MERYFLLFMSYSILGWILEVLGKFITKGKFVNRGFLIGPYCPIYGTGGLLMNILLKKYINDKLVLFIMAIIICSILEYVTSYIMEKLFHIRWWDYSNYKFNINGRICLETMIPFGILSILGLCYMTPFLLDKFSRVPSSLLSFCVIVLGLLYVIDNIISFRIIFGLNDITENVHTDSTEKVTAQVKKTIINNNKALYSRLIQAFPRIQISNKSNKNLKN